MTESIVSQSIQSPGDPVNFRLKAELLPDIPPGLHEWLGLDDKPSLYLYGGHGLGKTWLAVHAGLSVGGSNPGYWSERRYVQDQARLRWYETAVNRGPSSSEIFSEYVQFELAFTRLALRPILIMDELFYWGIQDFQQQELSFMIRNRFLCLDKQTTILVSNRLPEAGSPLRSTVDNNFTIVGV